VFKGFLTESFLNKVKQYNKGQLAPMCNPFSLKYSQVSIARSIFTNFVGRCIHCIPLGFFAAWFALILRQKL